MHYHTRRQIESIVILIMVTATIIPTIFAISRHFNYQYKELPIETDLYLLAEEYCSLSHNTTYVRTELMHKLDRWLNRDIDYSNTYHPSHRLNWTIFLNLEYNTTVFYILEHLCK